MKQNNDRGAAAVEFALVSVVLITLLVGIMEFGYAFLVQSTVSGAAREGARSYAITSDPVAARNRAIEASASLPVPLVASDIEIKFEKCGSSASVSCTCTTIPGDSVRFRVVNYQHAGLTGMFFNSLNTKAEAVMRCGG